MKLLLAIAAGVVGGYWLSKRGCGCSGHADVHDPPAGQQPATPTIAVGEPNPGLPGPKTLSLAEASDDYEPEAFATETPKGSYDYQASGSELTSTKISAPLKYEAAPTVAETSADAIKYASDAAALDKSNKYNPYAPPVVAPKALVLS